MQVKSSCFQLRGVNRLMLNTERPSLQAGEKTVTRSGLQDTFFGELEVNHLVWCVRSRAVYCTVLIYSGGPLPSG